MSARILILDDDQYIRISLRDRLLSLGYSVLEAESCSEARRILLKNGLDLVLLDLQLPDGDGLMMLDEITQMDELLEVIVITAHGSIERAVESMRRGAHDFLQKPFEFGDMEVRIKRALDLLRLKRDTTALQADRMEELERNPVVAASKGMKECLNECSRLSQTDTTVLILGETGTGKEVLARLIHEKSQRRHRPFVAISCANFTEELINDELFGHECGAFTGATTLRRGKVELADGGTLFLDEIGELSMELQAKLLRFLEERKYNRIGSERERETNVRVIAATNRNLIQEIKKKRFRDDLFYRLNVFTIQIPPLRERQEDIPPLVDHFLFQMAGRQGRRYSIIPEALQLLMKYHWPGNVRELKNVIERAIVISSDGTVRIKDLPTFAPAEISKAAGVLHSYHEQLAECEKQILLSALIECGGNRTKASERLGLHRTHFLRRLRGLGLQGDPFMDDMTDSTEEVR